MLPSDAQGVLAGAVIAFFVIAFLLIVSRATGKPVRALLGEPDVCEGAYEEMRQAEAAGEGEGDDEDLSMPPTPTPTLTPAQKPAAQSAGEMPADTLIEIGDAVFTCEEVKRLIAVRQASEYALPVEVRQIG